MISRDKGTAASMRFVALSLIVGAALGAAIGLLVLFRSVASDRQVEQLAWPSRLGQLAERQALGIDRWLGNRYTALRALADNASLQIYMTGLTQPAGGDRSIALAERKFLTDLLTVTAERSGFSERAPLPAELTNDQPFGHAGIALLAPDRRVVTATSGMPALDGAIGDALAALPQARRGFIDFTALADGQVVLGFLEPIYAVQTEPATDQLVGYVLGITKPDADLLAVLRLPDPHPADDLRVVVLRDMNIRQDHAILVAKLDGQTYSLDILVPMVLPTSAIRHYRPYYAINEQHWWMMIPRS